MPEDKREWHKCWSAPYSLTNCVLRGYQYTVLCQKVFGMGFTEAHFVFKNGLATLYRLRQEQEHFSKALADSFLADHLRAKEIVTKALEMQEELLRLFDEKRFFSAVYFDRFVSLYNSCAPYLLATKWAADAFTKERDPVLMFLLENGRRKTELLNMEVEKFLNRYHENIAMTIGGKEPVLFRQMAADEIRSFLVTWRMPSNLSVEILRTRFEMALLSVVRGQSKVRIGLDAEQGMASFEFEDHSRRSVSGGDILGTMAYPGMYHGKVRVVNRAEDLETLEDGEVLVAAMARPEWLGSLRAVGAVVTDIGGNLCHTAILCRELEKPCIIGTGKASEILKNGDLVEVDADRAVVTLLKRAE